MHALTRRGHRLIRHCVVSIALMATVSLLAASPAAAEQRSVRIGVYQNEPKVYTLTEKDGEPAGIFVDLIEKIAEEEGWSLVWVSGTWEEGLERLEAGQIDLMPDVAYSEERDAIFDFHTTPVVDSWSNVYAAPGVQADRISQLDGKRVAILQGSIQESVFQQMVQGFGYKIDIIPVTSLNEAFQTVSEGGADAAIANYLFGDYFYQDYNLVKTPIVFNAVPLFYATGQGRNPDLLEAIDARLSAWIAEPMSPYYETLSRYTTKEPTARLPKWVVWAAGIGVGLLVVTSLWAVALRWQVRAKTLRLAETAAALSKAEESLRLAVEAAEEGVFDWYPETGELLWSPQNYTMLGYEPGDLPMSSATWESLIHPDDRERVVSEELSRVVTGDHTFRVEYRLRGKDGSWIWTVSHGKAVAFDAEGNVERVMGTNANVTERKRAEAELAQYRDHLEDLVEARTRELAAANAELAEATEAKSRFFATMSHELRTPLNSIIAFSGLLTGGMVGRLTKEQAFQIGMIHDSGESLLALINDVLDLSKAEAGLTEVRTSRFDPIEVVRAAAETVRPLALEKGLTLNVEVPDAAGLLTTDRDRVRQILINILGNAVKYTEHGEVTIRLECGADGATFTVSDTGPGIPAHEIDTIFNAYHQAAHGEEGRSIGTGLGLSISLEFARVLGGDLAVSSVLGEGSVFTLTLPVTCHSEATPND